MIFIGEHAISRSSNIQSAVDISAICQRSGTQLGKSFPTLTDELSGPVGSFAVILSDSQTHYQAIGELQMK